MGKDNNIEKSTKFYENLKKIVENAQQNIYIKIPFSQDYHTTFSSDQKLLETIRNNYTTNLQQFIDLCDKNISECKGMITKKHLKLLSKCAKGLNDSLIKIPTDGHTIITEKVYFEVKTCTENLERILYKTSRTNFPHLFNRSRLDYDPTRALLRSYAAIMPSFDIYYKNRDVRLSILCSRINLGIFIEKLDEIPEETIRLPKTLKISEDIPLFYVYGDCYHIDKQVEPENLDKLYKILYKHGGKLETIAYYNGLQNAIQQIKNIRMGIDATDK